jgi:hypothetical protein
LSGDHWQAPVGVPTLTEVVVMPDPTTLAPLGPAAEAMPFEGHDVGARVVAPATPITAPPSPPMGPLGEDELVQRVLADLQHQIELMLEYRLREALTPILTRATDSIIRDARAELASTLRDVVARAVAQEMSRHRGH